MSDRKNLYILMFSVEAEDLAEAELKAHRLAHGRDFNLMSLEEDSSPGSPLWFSDKHGKTVNSGMTIPNPWEPKEHK